MPKPPDGVVERLNYISSFFFDPCDAPLSLYVETMLPALLEAAILWYSPVPDEIFTAWARPSRALGRMRSGRKGTGGSKAGRWGKNSKVMKVINFDTNEFIGKRLPGAELLGEATLFRGTAFLWRIFGFLQLLGLMWLVWEVVSGFFAKWFSLLYETEYCQATTTAVLDSYGTGHLISNVVENNGFLALSVQKQRGPIAVGPSVVTAGLPNLTVMAGFEIDGELPLGTYVDLVYWDGTPGTGEPAQVIRSFVGGSEPRSYGAAFTPKKGGTVGISLRTNALLVLLSRTTIYAQAGATS